ncbi:hypothetical protein BDW75DRAFT_219514 [Aspergillus navahoensis]
MSSNPSAGRQVNFEELWQTLRPDAIGTLKAVILKGEAGVGKSHLALHFAYPHDNDDDFSGEIWLDARSERALQSAMADKLLTLTDRGVAETSFTGDNARDLAGWLEQEKDSWLLGFDAYARGDGEGGFTISRVWLLQSCW